jgi:hypothetical protein
VPDQSRAGRRSGPDDAGRLTLGRVQDWYATGYREGTSLERIAIFPCWLVFRFLFVAAFALAQKMTG